jgi:serine/threonine protein kinase
MLAGYPPFFDDNPFGIYEKILAGKIDWPRHMDPIAKDLVKKLLVQDRTKRLGNMKVKKKRISFFFFSFFSGMKKIEIEFGMTSLRMGRMMSNATGGSRDSTGMKFSTGNSR